MTDRRALVVAAFLVVAAGLLSGCTGVPAAQPSAPTSRSASTPTTTGGIVVDSLVPDGSSWVDRLPAPTVATMLSADVARTGVSMPWKFLAFGPSSDMVEVAYVAGDGSCVLPDGFFATSLGEGVVLAAVSRQTSEQACGDRAVVGRAWVNLPKSVSSTAPLSHAPVDAQWSAPGFFD